MAGHERMTDRWRWAERFTIWAERFTLVCKRLQKTSMTALQDPFIKKDWEILEKISTGQEFVESVTCISGDSSLLYLLMRSRVYQGNPTM